jgi:hypothetical protein
MFVAFSCRRLLAAWQTKVFELLLAAGKIDQPTVDQMRCWSHSGFSVDNSVYLSPRDTAGLERLAQYILHCPFSLARVVRLTDDGSVLYRAEQDHCRRFPGAASADLRGGPRRNFQVFSAVDFLAEVTQQQKSGRKPGANFQHRKTERAKTEGAERQGRKSQNRARNPKQNIPNSSEHPRQRGGDGKKQKVLKKLRKNGRDGCVLVRGEG